MSTQTKKRKEIEDPNNTWNMQLVAALLKHNVETAAGLLQKGAEINHYAADASGVQLTPFLHVTIHGGCDESTLEWIAENGGDASLQVNKTSGTMFHYLAQTESLELLDKVCALAAKHHSLGNTSLARTLTIDAVDNRKITACQQAISAGRPDIARIFVLHGARAPFSDMVTARYTSLARACINGDAATADTLLASGDVPTQTVDGQTLFHLSLAQPAILDLLMERGVSINCQNSDGETPLIYVVKSKPTAIDVIDMLLAKGADPNMGDAMGVTPLMHAVLGHAPELVKKLLSSVDIKVDVNARDHFGGTALHWAITARQKGIVELLLNSEGVDVNAADGNGATALHRAATRGRQEILSLLLLQPGVDVNIGDKKGNTALHCAVIQKEIGCVAALIKRCSDDFFISQGIGVANPKDPKKPAGKKGAPGVAEQGISGVNPKLDIDAINGDGRTALQIAITVLHDTVIAAQLLSCGASVDRGGEKGGTLLHSAVWGDSLEMAETLLASGADASLRDDDDEAPLHIAAQKGSLEIASLLLTHHAVLDDQSSLHLRAPLHYACEKNDKAMIELFLTHNASPGLTDRFARTPLHLLCSCARQQSHEESKDYEARKQATIESAVLLLKHDAPVDVTDCDGWLPIHAACSADLAPVVAALIASGSPLTYADNRGWTPIHTCVAYGSCASLQLVIAALEAKCVNVLEELTRVDVLDRFPMMIAAEFGQKEAARMLVSLKN